MPDSLTGLRAGPAIADCDMSDEGRTSRPAPSPEWLAWFEQRRLSVDNAIKSHLSRIRGTESPHSRLPDAVEYSLAQPGKRVRPILVLEACAACGGTEENAWPAALAVECIHTFSLIHDDLPAMDDDDLRRGVPTNHKVFGEAMAILAGDWLVAHGLGLAARAGEPAVAARIVLALVGGTESMVVGQAADIASEGRTVEPQRVRFIHRHKTAALIEASCRMGALAAQATDDDVEAMGRFGQHLGLAFQICDDLLDKTATAADLGKRTGKDAAAAKQTYPEAFGIEESRRQADREVEACLHALERFGERGHRLRGMARFVVARGR